jgi:hypothetical protein
MTPLRPYQEEAIRRILAHPKRRQLLAHVPGAGKTRTAIETAAALKAQRILVVAPALARGVWRKEFTKWSDYVPHGIARRRSNKNLTKAERAATDAAYAADIQVVSYQLLAEIIDDPRPTDLLVLDESHRLGNPATQTAKRIVAFSKARPRLPIVMLSGTPAPTEARQLWQQIDILEPNLLGRVTKGGMIPWGFLNTYCNPVVTELPSGDTVTNWVGGKNLEQLRAKTAHLIHRVTEHELQQYLPPVRTEVLWLDEPKTQFQVAVDWLGELEDVTHVALVCYHASVAADLRRAAEKAGWPVSFVSGTAGQSVEVRGAIIDATMAAPRMCLIATAESIAESIDLSFIRQALIFEFHTSPGRSVQLLRRFGRTTSLPTRLQYVAMLGEDSRAETLLARLSDAARLLQQDKASGALAELFQARGLTDERLDKLFLAAFSQVNLSLLEADDDDSE